MEIRKRIIKEIFISATEDCLSDFYLIKSCEYMHGRIIEKEDIADYN